MIDRARYMEVDEARRFLALAKTLHNPMEPYQGRDYVLLSLGLNSGLRQAELTGLRIRDFGYTPEGKPFLEVWYGKGEKSRRVFINREMAGVLQAYVDRLRGVWGKKPEDFVFGDREGKRLPGRTARHIFARVRDAAGLRKDLSFHSLRHTFATYYFRNTRNVVNLRDVLGHSSIRTTQVYVGTSPEELALESDRLPHDLRPGPSRGRGGNRHQVAL